MIAANSGLNPEAQVMRSNSSLMHFSERNDATASPNVKPSHGKEQQRAPGMPESACGRL